MIKIKNMKIPKYNARTGRSVLSCLSHKSLYIIVLTILFACNQKPENTDKSSGANNTNTGKQSSAFPQTKITMVGNSETGNMRASLESDKQEFKKLDPVEFTLKLSDKNGNKINKAVITMSLEMPGMAMPKNEISFKENGNGTYTGTALFTMKGAWKLNTSIDTGKSKENIYFDLNVN
jgi:nitrogen fixation protein FixH